MNIKIAISGATGFIGQYVIKQLLQYNNIELYATYRDKTKITIKDKNIHYIYCDVASPSSQAIKQISQCDCLIHLAWDNLQQYHAIQHIEHSLPHHYNFIKTICENGLKNILVAGTCFEYGNKAGQLTETDIAQPNTSYSWAKYALYNHLSFLQQSHGFNLTWARLFYSYGMNEHNTIYSELMAAAQAKNAYFPMSFGEQLRDYLPIEDLANYIAMLSLKRQNIGIVNVCSGKPISMRQLVESWIRAHQLTIIPNYGALPYREYENMAFWGNNKKLVQLLET